MRFDWRMETVPDGVVYLCGRIRVWFDRAVSGLWRINRGPETLTYQDGRTPRRFRTAAHAKQYAEMHLGEDLEAVAPEADPPAGDEGDEAPASTKASPTPAPKRGGMRSGKRGGKPRVVMPDPDDGAGDEEEEDGDAEGEA